MRKNLLTSDWVSLFAIVGAFGLLTGKPLLITLSALVIIGWLVAKLWSNLALERLDFGRQLSQTRAFPGDDIEFRIHLTNSKMLPLPWVQITETTPVDIRSKSNDQHFSLDQSNIHFLNYSTSLSWYERVNWRVPIKCEQRGLYRFGPVKIASGDIFGLFRKQLNLDDFQELIIYPNIVPLPELGLPAEKPFGNTLGGEPIYEDPTRVAGVREYSPGDPLKKIDWKATARHTNIQVRLYEPSVSHSMFMIVNASTMDQEGPYGFQKRLFLERAVTTAASVAHDSFQNRFSVGLMTNSHSLVSEAETVISPSRNPNHLNLLLETLAMMGTLSSSSIDEMVWQQIHRFPLGMTLVFITAVMPDNLLNTLLDLRRKGHKLFVLWVGETPITEALGGAIQIYDIGKIVGSFTDKLAEERHQNDLE